MAPVLCGLLGFILGLCLELRATVRAKREAAKYKAEHYDLMHRIVAKALQSNKVNQSGKH